MLALVGLVTLATDVAAWSRNTVSWKNKTIVVTGATSGIGRATAVGLARLDSRLILVGRDAARRETIAEIRKATGRRTSRSCAATSRAGRTCGAWPTADRSHRGDPRAREQRGRDDDETHHHAGRARDHLRGEPPRRFLLTGLLLPRLRAAAPAHAIVNVASDAHRWGALDLDDLQNEREYKAMKVYGQSKTANILFTRELARRLEGSGISANAVHPGAVSTRLGRGSGRWFDLLQSAISVFMKSPEQGAGTSIYLASAPELEGVTGRYFADEKEKQPMPHASDPALAQRLWEISETLTGFRYA
jgi:NAD(P)-dependent dehydrogenase (short-subunit alcohol dehydrogenase family)